MTRQGPSAQSAFTTNTSLSLSRPHRRRPTRDGAPLIAPGPLEQDVQQVEHTGDFEELAREFLEFAVEDRHHGFSNVKDTIEEIHKGVSKAFPCGAGLGLMGVATDGEVALCHRFAGSDDHGIGSVHGGLDRRRQFEFLGRHHVANKTDCGTCWARPLCAGGCYHEAHVRYGDTGKANLHYCDWIRSWTDTCLKVYGEIAVRNPGYPEQFEG